MLPRPDTNFWSMSSGFSFDARWARNSPKACHVNVSSSGSMAMWSSSRTFPRSSDAVTNISPKVRGSMNRRSPPCWNVITTWVWGGNGWRFVARMNCPLIPKCTTSTSPPSRCMRMYLPLRSIFVILRDSRREPNSRRTPRLPGLACRRMARRAFGLGRTSTPLIRFPTTSFSRSRRMTSTSGSSTALLPLLGGSTHARGDQLREGLAGGLLLGLLLRAAPALPPLLPGQVDRRRELLRVVGPPRDHPVLGHRSNVLGRHLLEARLVVAVALAAGVGLHAGPEQALDQPPRRREPGVEVHRAQHGFHRVGQDARLEAAARELLAPAQQDELADAEVAGQLRELPEGPVGHHQPQHGVPQELQALVRDLEAVLERERAMRQGRPGQGVVVEPNLQGALQRAHVSGGGAVLGRRPGRPPPRASRHLVLRYSTSMAWRPA